jgi:hypothetical protein
MYIVISSVVIVTWTLKDREGDKTNPVPLIAGTSDGGNGISGDRASLVK